MINNYPSMAISTSSWRDATLDLPGQPGLGQCSAFLLGQLCCYMWGFQVLTNMDIPARGLSILTAALEKDHSYTRQLQAEYIPLCILFRCDDSLLPCFRESLTLIRK